MWMTGRLPTKGKGPSEIHPDELKAESGGVAGRRKEEGESALFQVLFWP